jgi:hypothetical protein
MSREEQLHRLLRFILSAHEDEPIDCEACAAQFECLAEQVARGVDIRVLLPQVEEHLACCADCREEFQALVAIIQAENAGLTSSQS